MKQTPTKRATYDLREDYVNRMARGLGAATDWEVLGLLHKTPEGYHFTRRGEPDKRYSNYSEVLAYWEAELDLRAEMIERATHAK